MIRYRTRFPRSDGNSSPDSAMTPMIDVVFLLLVFFVCTASFRLIEQILPGTVSPPAAGSLEQAVEEPFPADDFEKVVIGIARDGEAITWKVNGEAISDDTSLRDVLNSLALIKHDADLIVHPEPDVPMGYVIRAWDFSRLAGFEKIALAVNRD